jgi:hypothetical protein
MSEVVAIALTVFLRGQAITVPQECARALSITTGQEISDIQFSQIVDCTLVLSEVKKDVGRDKASSPPEHRTAGVISRARPMPHPYLPARHGRPHSHHHDNVGDLFRMVWKRLTTKGGG